MDWQSLTKTQKFLVTLGLLAILPFAPELLLIADIAGMEILLSCLLIYYRPWILKARAVYEQAKGIVTIIKSGVDQCVVRQPGVYFTQAAFYSLAIVFFSTGTFALVFLMPGFVISQS